MGLEPWLTLGGWIDTVSGVLFALLGVAVALVRPRRLLNAGFALFAIGFGVHFVCSNIRNVVPAVPLAVYDYGGDLGMALWAPGAVLVAERFPAPWRPLQASGRRLARGFTAVYLAAYIGIGWITAAFGHYDGTAGEPRWYDLGVAWPVQNAAWAALWMVLLALPLRFATPGPAARDRRAILLVAASLLAYNNLGDGMAAGVIFLHGSDGGLLAQGLADLVATLVVACLWAVAAARTTGADRRAAGWMAALGLACYAGGILFEQAVGSGEAANLGLLGLSRIAGVAVLAYAILRLQLFDIDVKVKWTLGRSTLVGIFVAVFFVVDQLIQVFAGRAFGPVAGGVACGILLLPLHPLQRMTERMADAAMPNVRAGDPRYVLERKRETYRNAYATAWADGVLTPKDVRMLHQVREALALPEKDVLAIERDWAAAAVPSG